MPIRTVANVFLLGLSAAALALVAMFAFLYALFGLYSWTHPSSDSSREMLALLGTLAALAIPVGVIVAISNAGAGRIGVSPLWSILVGGVLAGAAAHRLLIIISVVNSCGLEVSFPYEWIDACQR
ncbi:MAG: hypothetical protein WEC75_13405 [Dehalococcoidia bacterium]